MKRLVAVVLFSLAPLAAAQVNPGTIQPPPSERWFTVDRTSTGAVAGGNLAGTLWAFHVTGYDLKRLGDASATTFSIGGAVVQVRAIPRSVVKGASKGMLEAHKRYEQQHRAATAKGTTFRDHDLCRGTKLPHQDWIAQAPSDKVAQAHVTFAVGNYILMVVAPFENEERYQAVARVLGDVCKSFRVEKAPA